MSRKVCSSVFVVMVLLVAGTVAAQTTTIEIRQGEVLSVYGNHLVVKTDTGETKEYEVPEGFEFMHNGEMVGIDDLEPGMILTAAIKTTTTPTTVQTEEIKKGTVMAVVGRSAVIRNDDTGVTKRYKDIPSDFVFYVDGEPQTIYDLKKGMKVTAHIVHSTSETVTEREVAVMAQSAPEAAPAPAPAAQPASTTYSSSSTLPKTGSLLPLAGLVGLVALIAGLGLGVIRRF